jgi:hypothetical protein
METSEPNLQNWIRGGYFVEVPVPDDLGIENDEETSEVIQRYRKIPDLWAEIL